MPGGWLPFSVGLGSLEKQVVPDNICWMQQEWSFNTCTLNSPSPQSKQHTLYCSGFQEFAKEAQVYSDVYFCSFTCCQ